ncbi:MipA/OmpV family protein [Alishewanella tabrizica]|uniref:MipA/OmpV family protein n=1 Tax=Alishewanella tabrizica TaxID=671278 RepID=A0ABQ2WK08_9ALTE|nr:MipA/OmpV family protein [Alishewanella tabrizica]GGW57648.1 hypothetical protein GCM10008111_12170 [Alishewanella tabrizica]
MKTLNVLITAILVSVTTPVFAAEPVSIDRNFTGFESLNEAQPLWELGVGGGLINVPNYPASSERNIVGLALPYFIYRGDVFRFGDGNARAVIIDNTDFEIDISVAGAFSADSDNNTAREGMPELDYLFEVGPQVIYGLRTFEFNDGIGRLNLHLQARAVFSTDFSNVKHQGYVFQPKLSYQQRGVFFKDSAFSSSVSLVFTTEKLQDYFYQVDTEFASSNRDTFDAAGGFLGAEFATGISFSLHENIRAFAGGSIRLHKGAANTDSPLFEKDLSYSVGVGFVWRIFKSEALASW